VRGAVDKSTHTWKGDIAETTFVGDWL